MDDANDNALHRMSDGAKSLLFALSLRPSTFPFAKCSLKLKTLLIAKYSALSFEVFVVELFRFGH